MAECFPLLCYQTMSSVIPTIPRLVMEKILGGAALGIYGSVAAPTMIVQMGASYVFNPFITLFAEQYSSGNIRDLLENLSKMYGSNFADQCCRSGRRKDLRTLGAGTFVRG